MLKRYRLWNTFERRWFWSCLIITALGAYSLFIFKNILAIIIFEVSLIYYGNVIFRSLSRQEREWKGVTTYPVTDVEVK